jgi:heme exporter protein A
MALASSLANVEGRGLVCQRGERTVFRGLDFSVAKGALLTLEGPNGAGKTSALRMIAGLLAPIAGALNFTTAEGRTVNDGEERGRFVAWLGHADGIKAQLSVAENAAFFAKLAGDASAVTGVLAQVGLSRVAKLPAAYLSAGQRRRLGLARLLLWPRPLWLLDEPLAALDAAGRDMLVAILQRHIAQGGIAIAATHGAIGIAAERVVLGSAS